MDFRWLHISDLHFLTTAMDVSLRECFLRGNTHPNTNAPTSFDRIGLRGLLQEEPVDCIVLTGDLFHKGSWDAAKRDSAKNFLLDLYSICSEAGNWGWAKNPDGSYPFMDGLLYCPGNHDLNRHAISVSDGIISRRTDILQKDSVTMARSGNFLSPDSTEQYTLLTKDTFSPFHTAINKIINCSDIDDVCYEGQLFYRDFMAPKNETDKPITFISINTALAAGQFVDPSDLALVNSRTQSYTKFSEFNQMLKTKEALEEYKLYSTAVQKLTGQLDNDKGNLCFISEKVRNNIKTQLNELSPQSIVVFFGHHPLDFLSEEAAGHFINFAMQCNFSEIYLCGHTHKFGAKEAICPKTIGRHRIYQICTGGLFSDDSLYNQFGFSIGNIKQNNGTAKLIAKVYYYSPDPFGNMLWFPATEEYDIALPPNNAPMQQNVAHTANAVQQNNNPNPEIELVHNSKITDNKSLKKIPEDLEKKRFSLSAREYFEQGAESSKLNNSEKGGN